MTLIYEKLFGSEHLPAELRSAQTRAWATLEMILAASYVKQRRPVSALGHGLKAIKRDLPYATRILVRRLGRALP
jgi:hypothetical protein